LISPVAFDRALTLRNAEKLIRQGKVDAAIAEFVRIVEDQPQDWAAKNTLGDLYSRAGQTDKAVQQYVEIANNLSEEGAIAKAAALYKKILKLKPDHEHSLTQIADILGTQKLYADARAHLNTLIELRKSRGDVRGALQAKIRLGSLDPEDYEGRMQAVSARIEMRDVGGALSDLKDIANELAEKGRHAEAIEALRQGAKLNPDDEEIRERLLDIYLAAGDLARARECATSIEQFKMVAAALEAQGKSDEALDTLRQAAAQHDYDNDLRAHVARAFLAKGDMATAAQYLTVESAGNDPELLLTVADIRLRGETPDEGMAIVRKMLEEDPSRRERLAQLGWTVAESKPDAGFLVVEFTADHAVAASDWPAAAAVLQEFVTRVPNHIPALMRLVEICVDGGLEATMFSAQAQLADAYIEAGSATEARFIAEDLVAREPWDKANIERFRRALVLLGEQDPDALIASRLSGDEPFMSTDIYSSGLPMDEEPPAEAEGEAPPSGDAAAMDELMKSLSLAEGEVEEPGTQPAARKPIRHKAEEHQFELSANAIDLESILGDFDSAPPPPARHAEPAPAHQDTEVDISLDEIKPGATAAPPPPPPPAAKQTESGDLDAVFGNMRDQASRRSGLDDAEKEYKKGLALRSKGDIEGCIAALEKASRAPKLRFSAAWLIARLYRDRTQLPQALEWLERAAQAPAPNVADGHQLLFELADGLEKAGEGARALAVLLELQADAGAYRDIDQRIDRLTKVQAG
jgi:tetratricopeptide (TPR) repeat protein